MIENAITVKNLSKTFKLPHEQNSGLKQSIINFLKNKRGYEIQKVLSNLSFEVKKGDFFGIVGRNGSGKSTLLKLLAGIYTPDSGTVIISGSVIPFIELGVGFNPELTGRENIFLNGALLGFSHKEVEDMFAEIVEFAELDKFMDQKLKNYSSGMQVRLAFSIAIKAQGDILILDEVLAVGDEAFQKKCDVYFDNIKKDKSKTVILVTHSMGSVQKYCNKALLIKNGSILALGDPSDIANKYTEENINNTTSKKSANTTNRVSVFKNILSSNKVLKNSDFVEFDIEYDFKEKCKFYLAFSLIDLNRGGVVYDSGINKELKYGHNKKRVKLPLKLFNDTDFQIVSTLRISEDGENKLIAFTDHDSSCYFSIRNNNKNSNYALLNSLK